MWEVKALVQSHRELMKHKLLKRCESLSPSELDHKEMEEGTVWTAVCVSLTSRRDGTKMHYGEIASEQQQFNALCNADGKP